MAAVLRSTILRIAPTSNLFTKHLPCIHQVAGISSKALRDLKGIKRPPPYDYENKPYGFTRALFDKTTPRLDDNSKIILVEGPAAVGKTEFAKELAKELDMKYFPQANMDSIYISSYGYNLRELNYKLPHRLQTFDTNDFLKSPKDERTANFQLHLYKLKFFLYVEALAHLLSTGQGVVLERSPFSDAVFADAIYEHKLISKLANKAINEVRDVSLQELLQPHLVIYLDAPVDVVQQRIKERNNPAEVNSELFKDNKYLQTLENLYKQEFLKKIGQHAELLVYDWSNGGEVELVVEDIERIDFDSFEIGDTKMADWLYFLQEWDWCEQRMKYTTDSYTILSLLDIPIIYCDEMSIPPHEDHILHEVYGNIPGMEYAYGYNKDAGDTGLLFKTKREKNKFGSFN